jgi:transglutaminase-like putative cysteine protease
MSAAKDAGRSGTQKAASNLRGKVITLQVKEGRLSFFLLMLMLFSIAWSVEMANWVKGLYVVEWTLLGGLVLGFLVTRSRWPRALSHLVSLLVGVPLILWVMARYIGSDLGWRDGLSILAYHFDTWLQIVSAGQTSADTAMFVLLATVLGWWLGYTSAWLVFGTHKVWQALALTGAAMLLVAYGSPPEALPFFLLFMFCALLLAIRVYAYRRQQSWEKAKARYDRDVSFYFLRDGGLLVAVVLTAVWIMPLLSSSPILSDLWAQVEGPWGAMGDEWNRLFSGITGYRQDYENSPFGDRLALGGPVNLSGDMVMWVEAEEGQYWRGALYDRYDGTGWENTDGLNASVATEMHLPLEGEYELRRLVRQTVTPNWSGVGQVFGLGQPIDVGLPIEIRYSFVDSAESDGQDPFSAPAMVSLIKSRVPLRRGQSYGVVSSTSVADVESLREAGDNYPAWITRRYLQLPPALPQRVAELAQEMAAPYDNAYDRATALQDYLRGAIVYNQDIEAPPPGRDGVDYLLFDSREGYCNYYASAMVVMARAAGIPSRLAVGYVGGDFDSEIGQYSVRERNTHAWVEVYFPRYGWVEFEPTASEEPIRRPVRSDEAGPERERPDVESDLERDLARLEEVEDIDQGLIFDPPSQGPSLIGYVLVGLVAALGAVGVAYWSLRSRRSVGLSGVHKAYRQMCSYARFLGVGGRFYQTPYEYGVALATLMPSGARQVGQITDFYVEERFAASATGPAEEQEAQQAWRELRPIMTRELLRRLPRLVRRTVRWRR